MTVNSVNDPAWSGSCQLVIVNLHKSLTATRVFVLAF